jgi:hypothetical protein
MKKLGLLALVLGLVIAFAVPAMSFTIEGAKGEKMYIGGVFMTDAYWQSRSKELVYGYSANGQALGGDLTQFVMAVPIHSRLRGSLEIGNVGGFWEFGMGGSEANTSGAVSTYSVNNYVETRKLYGWYKFGNCELRAGKDDGYYFSVVPSQYMGTNQGHIFGFGWGVIYDVREPQLRFTQNVSKEFGYMVTLLQPTVWTDASIGTTPNRLSYNTFPRLAAKLMINTGMFSFYPAFQGQYAKWDQLNNVGNRVGTSPDDNITSWQAQLPIVMRAGPFTGTLMGYYGQNSAPFIPFASSFHTPARELSSGSIKNTTDMGGFINLAYTVGAATPALYFGYDNAKNSDIFKGPTGDDYNNRMMLGGSVLIKIAEGFFIAPELSYYDYGKYPAGVANAGRDIGKEWMGGVQFSFIF